MARIRRQELIDLLQGSERRSVPSEELAGEAVDAISCTCATTAADVSAGGRSLVHAGLIAEVLRGVRLHTRSVAPDPVEVASEQSFSASDPPAWI